MYLVVHNILYIYRIIRCAEYTDNLNKMKYFNFHIYVIYLNRAVLETTYMEIRLFARYKCYINF